MTSASNAKPLRVTRLKISRAAAGGRRPLLGRIGAALVLAGCVCERFSVFEAGRQSALDPAATVDPQRARLAERERG